MPLKTRSEIFQAGSKLCKLRNCPQKAKATGRSQVGRATRELRPIDWFNQTFFPLAGRSALPSLGEPFSHHFRIVPAWEQSNVRIADHPGGTRIDRGVIDIFGAEPRAGGRKSGDGKGS
jgi:hypothetical protein